MRIITALRRALLPGTAALLALAAATGCGTDNGDGDGATPPAATGTEFNEADVSFAQNMLMHHQQALEMVELAGTTASDPELTELSASIAATLAPEITTMTGWLTAWGEPTEPAGGHAGMSMPGMASRLSWPRPAAAATDAPASVASVPSDCLPSTPPCSPAPSSSPPHWCGPWR